jgi:ATPase subunit of ABC transporter with duplicated ATPase domains
LQWPGKKIKLDEEAISEIQVTDTDSESGSEASDFEEYFEEEDEEEGQQQQQQQQHQQQQQQQQASAEVETQAATSDGLPTWGPPQGRNTNIHPFVGPAKGVKKSEAPHINKDSSPLSLFFHLLVEQTNVYYQQHLDSKPDLAADCLTLRCRT